MTETVAQPQLFYSNLKHRSQICSCPTDLLCSL